jgi:hypothetical protein
MSNPIEPPAPLPQTPAHHVPTTDNRDDDDGFEVDTPAHAPSNDPFAAFNF